jgi:hypothetical protein
MLDTSSKPRSPRNHTTGSCQTLGMIAVVPGGNRSSPAPSSRGLLASRLAAGLVCGTCGVPPRSSQRECLAHHPRPLRATTVIASPGGRPVLKLRAHVSASSNEHPGDYGTCAGPPQALAGDSGVTWTTFTTFPALRNRPGPAFMTFRSIRERLGRRSRPFSSIREPLGRRSRPSRRSGIDHR